MRDQEGKVSVMVTEDFNTPQEYFIKASSKTMFGMDMGKTIV